MASYRIEKTSNRHSRAVLKNDVIVIRLARGLSSYEEQRHVTDLLNRMSSVVLRERSRPRIDPFRPLLTGEPDLTLECCTGTKVRFVLTPGASTRAKALPDGWAIAVGPKTDRRTLHRFLWKLLSRSILKDAHVAVHSTNDTTMNFRVRSVRLRSMSSQWGSCSTRGDITLNTALFVLPKEFLEYVIVHELAHLRYAGHGPRFWALVERFCPDVSRIRKELRRHRIVVA